jgi:hypothetical protein
VVDSEVDLIELLDSARKSHPIPSLRGLKSEEISEYSRSPRQGRSEEEESNISPAGRRLSDVGVRDSLEERRKGKEKDKEEGSDSWSDGEVECVVDFTGKGSGGHHESHGVHGTKSGEHRKQQNVVYVSYFFLFSHALPQPQHGQT